MRNLGIEEEGLLSNKDEPQDVAMRLKLGVKPVPALATLVLVLLVVSRLVYHNLPQGKVSHAIDEMSEVMLCLPCHENECELRQNQWSRCPADKPYFSQTHCKCLSSEVCDDDSPRVAECRICQNCFDHACHIDMEYVRCPGEAKYYHPATSLCQKDCDVASMEVDLADVSNVENPLEPKITPFVCPINTYGTCKMMKCHETRGPTTCSSNECICEPGHCAYRGSCLEEAKFNKAEHLCQHNTFVSCRVWGCPSTLGETKCDGFLSGLGTYNCLCEDGHCYDPSKAACVKKDD